MLDLVRADVDRSQMAADAGSMTEQAESGKAARSQRAAPKLPNDLIVLSLIKLKTSCKYFIRVQGAFAFLARC